MKLVRSILGLAIASSSSDSHSNEDGDGLLMKRDFHPGFPPLGGTLTPKVRAKRGQGYELAHHLAKMSDNTKSVFELLREQILALGGEVTERFIKQYVALVARRTFFGWAATPRRG
jgi:hypothetical protein